MITINKDCSLCHSSHKFLINEKDLVRFHNGEHIQDVMPYLTADERELMISGICGKCFDEVFSEE